MKQRIKAVVYLVNFVAFLGIALPYPIMTPLFMNGDIATPFSHEISLGLVLALYPIGLFLGGSSLGSFSDKYGRRPVLLFSLSCTMVFIVWSGWAIMNGNFWQLLISRFVTGFFEASSSVARAMLIDIEKGETKASSFAILSASAYGGYLFGPLMGGYLAYFSAALPFYVAGFMGFSALSLAILWLPETNASLQEGGKKRKRPKLVRMLLEHSMFRKVLFAQFLLTIGTNTFYQFFPLFLVKRWGSTSSEIANANVFFTGSMILFALFGVKRLEKVINLGPKLVLSGVATAVMMLVILLAPSYTVSVLIAIVAGWAVAVLNASLPAFLNKTTMNELEQGAVMGALTSSFCLAQATISLVGSRAAAFYGIEATFIIGGTAALVGAILVQIIRPKDGASAPH